MEQGANIAMSHELFLRLAPAPKVKSAVLEHGYTLVIDEVLEVVQLVPGISNAEIELLMQQDWLTIGEGGKVRWTAKEKPLVALKGLKPWIRNRYCVWYQKKVLLSFMPIALLMMFPEIVVMTFMFHSSHMCSYLDVHNIAYQLFHLEDSGLKEGYGDLRERKRVLQGQIHIYAGKMNDVGKMNHALSKRWYENKKNKGKVIQVARHSVNFLRHKCGATKDDAMWTCYESVQKHFMGKGYNDGFCACNARATNDYRHRRYLAYLVNLHPNPYVRSWFREQGAEMDEDAFALSQMLQWVWRSAIREGEPIRLYIPSSRVRGLLEAWLAGEMRNPASQNP